LSTWLYRIATNAALDRIRTPAYQQKASTIPADIVESEVDDRNIWTGEKVPVLEW
jgi:DNA-directed RNA polymerase specialized sigma24 family protein